MFLKISALFTNATWRDLQVINFLKTFSRLIITKDIKVYNTNIILSYKSMTKIENVLLFK